MMGAALFVIRIQSQLRQYAISRGYICQATYFCSIATQVHICDECNYGSYQGRCIICGAKGMADAYYCKECTLQEKDRDGCPKIINYGTKT
ncbi:MAG: putative ATPase 9, plasma membrane-type [Streblomastix strix]|uniref:Putative ATPase 9, plasma membrane-type n=1 Tax=Streblomastix strix TaxID=222440 RepID=A0A5J4W0Q5_9EUKA|nr:MAG: putative ATPase 9, plasma membrane-type [Streblomastix strix]